MSIGLLLLHAQVGSWRVVGATRWVGGLGMGWFCHGDETGGKGWGRPELAACGPRKERGGGGGSHSCLAVVLRVILFGWALLGWVLVGDQNANRRGKRRGNIILEVTWITDVLQLFYFIVF